MKRSPLLQGMQQVAGLGSQSHGWDISNRSFIKNVHIGIKKFNFFPGHYRFLKMYGSSITHDNQKVEQPKGP